MTLDKRVDEAISKLIVMGDTGSIKMAAWMMELVEIGDVKMAAFMMDVPLGNI